MRFIRSFFSLLLITPLVVASPGAHGPNGEHLDMPGGHMHIDSGPRIDTFTELFELLGYLQKDELSILIDRYETNEPVLNGNLEVEFNGLKALARFHDDHGDYAIDDEEFLKALSKPGKHSLVFTLTVDEESDLLEGTLVVPNDDVTQDHGYSSIHWSWMITAVIMVIVLLVPVMYFRQRITLRGK